MTRKQKWYQLIAEFSDGSHVVLRETKTSFPLYAIRERLAGINLYRDRVYRLNVIEVYYMPQTEKS